MRIPAILIVRMDVHIYNGCIVEWTIDTFLKMGACLQCIVLVVNILLFFIIFYLARSDRYSHEFMSDEEDGGEPDLLEQPFENFSSTAPRMSSYLDETLK